MSPERVWTHRQIRRGDYEIECDGKVVGFVSLQGGLERPSLAIRRIVTALADTEGGTVAGTPGVDWEKLGWTDQAEHDALVDQVAQRLREWQKNDLGQRALAIVHTRKLEAGLPARPPYSLAQLDELDRIIAAAPEIAHQDEVAERGAA
jgi:hypothetical protein